MISIIVPVYKAEQFIHKCIDSILIQTYQDWECILIDDGSPDKSGDICDAYARKDNRIIVIHQQNGGVSSARNTGLINAKGEWITFLDSDDYWDNNYLHNLISHANSDLIISEHKRFGYSNTEYFFHESRIIDAELFIKNLLELPSYIDNYVISISYPWGKLLRADIIINNNLRFNNNMKLSEDTCFILDYISCCYKLQFIKGGKYNYYIPSSKTYKMTFREYQNHIKGISASVHHLQKKFHNKSNVYLFSFYPMYFTAFWENLIILSKEEQAKEYELFKHCNNIPLYILTKGYSKTRVSAIKLAFHSKMMLYLISKLENIR